VTWRWGMDLAFDRSPYAQPIGGQDENLLERDRADILNFWRSGYRPDNMTVVAVGDLDPAATFALLQEKLGGKTAARLADDPEVRMVDNPPVERPHDRCRLQVEQGDIQRAYAKLIFRCPGENSGTRPVLSVARRVLSDGRSCRLYRQVQENSKLVDDFAFMTETGPREGAILVDMETDPKRLPEALQAICGVLKELGHGGPTETELERARVRVKRSFLFGEETIQGQASTLGYHDAVDDLPGAFQFPQRVDAVTSEQVAEFCRGVFRLGDLSCVIYLPQDCIPADTGIPTSVEALEALLAGHLDDAPAPAPADLTPSPVIVSPVAGGTGRPDRGDLPFETLDLGGGTVIALRHDDTLPLVSMALTVKGGSTLETETDAGLTTLMQMVQVKGAGGLTSEALHEALEGDGASLLPLAERDYSGLALSGLTGRLEKPLALLGDALCRPTFSETEIEQERRLALEQLASLADNPFQAAAVRLRRMVYGDHPYGRPLPGTEESLARLTREDLIQRHRRLWTRDNLQIVVSGDFSRDEFLPQLEAALADLPATSGEAPLDLAPGAAQVPDGIQSERMTREQNQSVVLVAWPGPRSVEEDRVPLILLKEVLNGQSGRLFESLRNRRSLCYNTGTLSTAGFGQGMFLGYVLTEPAKEDEAREVLVDELAQLGTADVDAAEFERARAKLLGNLLIGTQSNGAHVSRTARDLVFGRPCNDLDRLVGLIKTCQPSDVREVAARLLTPEQRFQITIGP